MNVEDLKRFCKIESKSDFIAIENELNILKINFCQTYLKIFVKLFTVLIKIFITKDLNLSIPPNTKIYCSHVRSILGLASVLWGLFVVVGSFSLEPVQRLFFSASSHYHE
ncbi:hypothetical protein FWK35_00021937 [Aphis craccivora]|uniref:Uncharacterized protein n=1 Tax=Aphis craccivora TaxID=307492 RepID=A0A6G0Y7J9_APHCR|nr:hypothetical protein FWK35_00021937 [Aphis craccivora]